MHNDDDDDDDTNCADRPKGVSNQVKEKLLCGIRLCILFSHIFARRYY